MFEFLLIKDVGMVVYGRCWDVCRWKVLGWDGSRLEVLGCVSMKGVGLGWF